MPGLVLDKTVMKIWRHGGFGGAEQYSTATFRYVDKPEAEDKAELTERA